MQMRETSFDLHLTYQGENVRVTGLATPYIPATGPSMESAGGDPAEGGEIEDFHIYAEDGTEMEDPDGDILSELEDEIHEAINDGIVDVMSDAAEHNLDQERDR